MLVACSRQSVTMRLLRVALVLGMQGTSACPIDCALVRDTGPSICGSDGVTYGTTCLLAAKQCRDPSLFKLHDGECNDADKATPQEFESAEQAPVISDCTALCNQVDHAVCGLNNMTYRNPCHFHNAQCEDNTIRLAHVGPCMGELPRLPPFCIEPCTAKQQEYAPTCGSDRVTYYNACAFKEEFCEHNSALAVVHEGPCW